MEIQARLLFEDAARALDHAARIRGRIDLKQKGRKRAEHLALRHQLAEMLLTDVIGLSWAKAHD